MSLSPDHMEQIKAATDVSAVGVAVAAILEWLPAVAALFTVIWTLIRIYETDTVQRIVKRSLAPHTPSVPTKAMITTGRVTFFMLASCAALFVFLAIHVYDKSPVLDPAVDVLAARQVGDKIVIDRAYSKIRDCVPHDPQFSLVSGKRIYFLGTGQILNRRAGSGLTQYNQQFPLPQGIRKGEYRLRFSIRFQCNLMNSIIFRRSTDLFKVVP